MQLEGIDRALQCRAMCRPRVGHRVSLHRFAVSPLFAAEPVFDRPMIVKVAIKHLPPTRKNIQFSRFEHLGDLNRFYLYRVNF